MVVSAILIGAKDKEVRILDIKKVMIIQIYILYSFYTISNIPKIGQCVGNRVF